MTAEAKTECSCARCVTACKTNPGWMTPDEARAAIAAGHAGKLMRDWWEPDEEFGNEERVYLLAPASEGHGGRDGPELPGSFVSMMFWSKGRCEFLDQNDRCEIHASGFKPLQCRLTFVCDGVASGDDAPYSNFKIAKLWDTPLGAAVIAEWRAALKARRGKQHA